MVAEKQKAPPSKPPVSPPKPVKKAPNFVKPSGDAVSSAGSKKAPSVREQVMEQVRENLQNPKKLEEIKRQHQGKVDVAKMVHQAKTQSIKDQKTNPGLTSEHQILRRMEQSKIMIDRLQAIRPTPPLYADSVL